MKPRVSLVLAKEHDDPFKEAIKLLGGLPASIKPGGTVLIKPNLTVPRPSGHPAVTGVRIIKSVVDLVCEAGAKKVYVGECPGGNTAWESFEAGGYEVLEKYPQVQLIDFDDFEYAPYEIENYRLHHEYFLPTLLEEMDAIISIAKIKTHSEAIVSLTAKNTIGLTPTKVYGKPRLALHRGWQGAQEAVADLANLVRFDLCLLDGLPAMEGEGPIDGEAVDLGVFCASYNQMAIDSLACWLMGVDPSRVAHLWYLHQDGHGPVDLDALNIVGLAPESVFFRRFKLPKRFAGESYYWAAK
jgi:uncharacterized protein (DUF362 family)